MSKTLIILRLTEKKQWLEAYNHGKYIETLLVFNKNQGSTGGFKASFLHFF